jgi:hypothetical protein
MGSLNSRFGFASGRVAFRHVWLGVQDVSASRS